MAQLKVIRKFRDKTNEARVFGVGEIITIADTERVQNILSLGLAEPVDDEKQNVPIRRSGRKRKGGND